MSHVLNIGLFGPPGSGKGTQATTLIDEFGFVHLAPGDLLREEIKQKTPLGRQAEAVIASGQLMPDQIIHAMIGGRMAPVLERGGRILLDGFPRTLVQLAFLNDFLRQRDAELNGVFFLDLDRDRLIERLTGRRICAACGTPYHITAMPPTVAGICDACGGALVQRKDDVRDAIEERLAAYERQTFPVMQALEAEGKVIRIDGDQPREAVYAAIAGPVRQMLQATGSRQA